MSLSPVDVVLTISTGLVASTLILSSVGKWGRSPETLRAMTALRVPTALRRPLLARLFPVAELVLGIALMTLPGVWRQVTGGVAAVMLLCFTALLIGTLSRGDDVDCGCFGPLSAETRVTTWSVLRNLVLAIASASIAAYAAGSQPFFVQIFGFNAVALLSVVVAWAILLIIVLVRALYVSRNGASSVQSGPRSISRGQVQPAPLSPLSIALGLDPARPGEVAMGDSIPLAELVAAGGQTRRLSALGNGRPTLLVFLSADCSSCVPVAEAVPVWAERLVGVSVHVATSSDPAALAKAYPGLPPFARYGSHAALTALGVQRSPAAVLLGGQQHPVIASPIAYGVTEIEGLVQSAVSSATT